MKSSGSKIFILTAIVIIAVIAVFWHYVDHEKFLQSLRDIGPLWFLGFGACILVSQTLGAFSWWLILKTHGQNIRFRDAMYGRLIGWSVSMTTPCAHIGGEPVRSYFLSKKYNYSLIDIFARTLLDKILEWIAFLFWVYATGLYLLFGTDIQGQTKIHLTIFMALGTICVGSLLFSFIFKIRLFEKINNFFIRLGWYRKILMRARPKIKEMDNLLHNAFSSHLGSTLVALICHITNVMFILIRPLFVFIPLLGLKIFTPAKLAILFAVSQIFHSIPATPGSAGILEVGINTILKAMDIETTTSAVYLAIYRTWDAVFVLIGIYFIVHFGLRSLIKSGAIMSESLHAENDSKPTDSINKQAG